MSLAEDMTRFLRGRGVLSISTGSRVRLSLALHSGDVVDTEPQETLEAAFAQLKERVRAREEAALER